jgi:hypothetical protein
MTASFTTSFRRAVFVVAVAAFLSALVPSVAFAFSTEAQQMCTGDAFRLCASEIPNIPKVTACMVRHRANLSTGCRAVMDREMAQRSSTVAQR